MPPLISVIIPCYNAAPWISQALESVYAQTMAEMEIIVVDDGSTDNSAAIVQYHYPNVHLIQTPNRGASAARNTGTAAARGAFIQYLDADDLLAPNKLQLQVQALESSGADVAYGDWQYLLPQPNGSFIASQTVSGRFSGDPQIALFVGWCASHSYLYRRHIVERIGSWPEHLPIVEDAHFAFEAAFHGARFVHVPGALVYYRKHLRPTSLSTHSSTLFTRCVYINATEVEAMWRKQGTVSLARLSALRQVYNYVARTTYATDSITFEQAYAALRRLSPGGRYVPDSPRHLALASHLLGYPRAEWLAARSRVLKAALKRIALSVRTEKPPST